MDEEIHQRPTSLEDIERYMRQDAVKAVHSALGTIERLQGSREASLWTSGISNAAITAAVDLVEVESAFGQVGQASTVEAFIRSFIAAYDAAYKASGTMPRGWKEDKE